MVTNNFVFYPRLLSFPIAAISGYNYLYKSTLNYKVNGNKLHPKANFSINYIRHR